MLYKGYELHYCWCGYPKKQWHIYNNGKWTRTESSLKKAKAWINSQLGATNKRPVAAPGSVIHGTMRPVDVIPALCKTLHSLDAKRYSDLLLANTDLNQALCDKECGIPNDWWDGEDTSFAIEALCDALDGYAPEGHHFGTHPGDGSDLGFWPDELN